MPVFALQQTMLLYVVKLQISIGVFLFLLLLIAGMISKTSMFSDDFMLDKII